MEEFRPIKVKIGYSVSNTGKVRNDTTKALLKLYLAKTGYHLVYIDNNPLPVHRLVAWAFLPICHKPCIDHIDRNRTNNNADNLRWSTYQENLMNRSIFRNNTSGHKGVYLHKPTGKWYACAQINLKLTNLGYFDTKEEAIKKRHEVVNFHYGEFCNE